MARTELTKLNLGCGNKILKGWVNLDKFPLEGVDVVYDIEDLPLPFDSEQFDEILCEDILEHVEYIDVLREIYRILKKGGKLHIRVPHFSSRNNFVDPTHKNQFSVNTFDFFVKHGIYRNTTERSYYFDFQFTRINKCKIVFAKNPIYFYNYLVEAVINFDSRIQDLYEMTLFSRIFPAENIVIEIQK